MGPVFIVKGEDESVMIERGEVTNSNNKLNANTFSLAEVSASNDYSYNSPIQRTIPHQIQII